MLIINITSDISLFIIILMNFGDLNEIITSKVIVAVAAVVLGIYFVRRSIKNNVT